jgi:hypothetical protein
MVPFGVEDAMVIKPEEIVEESILLRGQLTSDILNNIDNSNSDDNDYVYDDISSTSEIIPIYVRPVLNQAFYNPIYNRDEK